MARLASLQTPVIERVRGYNNALKAAGLQEYSNVVGEDFSIQNGYIETKLLLSYKDRPTAILALSNTILLGEIKAITEARMTISKDISIISFDNNLFLDYLTPSITRVEQPIQEIGILATRTMIKYLKGREKIGASHNSVQLLPKLIIGDSVRNLRKQ
ncbi:MAG: substrate-binding domain-containing protein [Bacteroidales bacterium]|nr:substrate-binding domain-containing protein [Bacteroidales bacterium]